MGHYRAFAILGTAGLLLCLAIPALGQEPGLWGQCLGGKIPGFWVGIPPVLYVWCNPIPPGYYDQDVVVGLPPDITAKPSSVQTFIIAPLNTLLTSTAPFVSIVQQPEVAQALVGASTPLTVTVRGYISGSLQVLEFLSQTIQAVPFPTPSFTETMLPPDMSQMPTITPTPIFTPQTPPRPFPWPGIVAIAIGVLGMMGYTIRRVLKRLQWTGNHGSE